MPTRVLFSQKKVKNICFCLFLTNHVPLLSVLLNVAYLLSYHFADQLLVRGVFSTGAMGALAPAILVNLLLSAPAIQIYI